MLEQADNRPSGNSHVLACNSISAFRALSRTSTAELAARGRWPVLPATLTAKVSGLSFCSSDTAFVQSQTLDFQQWRCWVLEYSMWTHLPFSIAARRFLQSSRVKKVSA